jgi:hypothetical protein
MKNQLEEFKTNTRAVSLYGSLTALQDVKDYHTVTARDSVSRAVRRIHKTYKVLLTKRLQQKLKEIGCDYNEYMTTSEIYRLNHKLKNNFKIDRIIHVEHMNGGVKSIADKLMSTNLSSVKDVLQVIDNMTFMAARLLEVEDHLCENTSIEEFKKWNC